MLKERYFVYRSLANYIWKNRKTIIAKQRDESTPSFSQAPGGYIPAELYEKISVIKIDKISEFICESAILGSMKKSELLDCLFGEI